MINTFNSASVFFSFADTVFLRRSNLDAAGLPSKEAVTADKFLVFYGPCPTEANLFFLRKDTVVHFTAIIDAVRFRNWASEISRI